MNDKKHLAMITILIKERQTHAQEVNKLLAEHGDIVISRLGVNVGRCGQEYSGMISVAVEAGAEEINGLTAKLDSLYGIVAKNNIMTL